MHLLIRKAAKITGNILVAYSQRLVERPALTSSVRAEELAMALAQPKVWNLASRILSLSLSIFK